MFIVWLSQSVALKKFHITQKFLFVFVHHFRQSNAGVKIYADMLRHFFLFSADIERDQWRHLQSIYLEQPIV